MATYEEIARRAACSVSTVGRVLNRSGPVGAEMIRRVRQAESELAASLYVRRHERRMIGVLVPSVTNPVFAQSLSSIQERMRGAGHGVLIAQSNYDPEQEVEAVAALLAERPRGLILTVCSAADSAALGGALPPTVLLHNAATPDHPAAVTVDNHRAAERLTAHLVHLGHRRILFVSGEFTASDRAARRHQGYRAAMMAAGLAPLEPVEVSFIDDYAMLDLTGALAEHRPSAIIASNDLLALGVLHALRSHGVAVPADVSVAGFDGMAIGRMIAPTLSTVDIPNAAMGAVAASLLLDMLDNAAPARSMMMDVQLYPGGTVRDLR